MFKTVIYVYYSDLSELKFSTILGKNYIKTFDKSKFLVWFCNLNKIFCNYKF